MLCSKLVGFNISSSFSFRFSSIHQRVKMSIPTKISKLTKYIGTHEGAFHCDDVTACFMLQQLDRFKDHEIIRTRDPEKLAHAEIIVDVGSELDIEKLRLDHHQRSFTQTIKDYHPNLRTTNPNKPPRLSSSGLVYAIFGKDIIAKVLNLETNYIDLSKEFKLMVDAVYERAYVEFFEEIDAIDNGVEVASGDNLVYNYHINTGLSTRVGRLNPIEKDAPANLRLKQFHAAMKVVGGELLEGIKYLGEIWWPTRQQYRKFIEQRLEVHPSGSIVYLADETIGWKSALLDLEQEMDIVNELKFVIFQTDSIESPWRVTAIPVSLKSFASRVPLKEEWRGKRDKDLQETSGVSDAGFVHMSGFTGGAKTREGVIKMISITLGLNE